jgi:hypothetical protein
MGRNVETRFLSRDELWSEIKRRLNSAKRVRVAVAYFSKGGASLLPLRKGDTLVADMSPGTVMQGATDPREIQKLFSRGVEVFTRGSLHAKLIVVDRMLFASSANVSKNAFRILDEAGVGTSKSSVVSDAVQYIDSLCTEPVTQRYIDECIRIYRPPRFKSIRTLPRQPARAVRAKLWFVGGLVPIDPKGDAEVLERMSEEAASDLDDTRKHEVAWIRYGYEPRFLANIKKNNRVVDCTRIGNRSRLVGPPARVIRKRKYTAKSGKVFHVLMLEVPKGGESIPFSKFCKLAKRIAPELTSPVARTRPVHDPHSADMILRLWNSSGRVAKRKR